MTEGGLVQAQTAPRRPIPKFDWVAHKGPQERFLGLTCFEGLYGGAAGGGKSDALLIDAIRYVGRGYGARYKALLLRRTFPDLEKSLIDRSRELYTMLGGIYREDKRVWRFPHGEKVFFGYLDQEKDVRQYQGAAFQFIGWDELTHFTRKQYIYLFSRCRSAHGVPCRVRGATNPGGEGNAWVYERWGPWINPKHPYPVGPGEVRYFLTDEQGVERQVPKGTVRVVRAPDGTESTIPALGRVFVPAKLEDNPDLLADPTYQAGLDLLDPVTRMQLRHGKWDVVVGKKMYFDRAWVELLDAVPPKLRWFRPWDFASTEPSKDNPDPDWTRGLGVARWGKKVLLADLKSLRGGPGAVEDFLAETAKADGKGVTQLLPQDPGSAGKSLAARYQQVVTEAGGSAEVILVPRKNKLTRFKPFSGFASPPNQGVAVVRGAWNQIFFDELETFEGEDEGDGHDDCVDVASDGFNKVIATGSARATNASTGGERRSMDGW